MRARNIHHLEVFTDNVVGYALNIVVAIVIFNGMLGYNITISDNMIAGLGFFIFAYIRKYTLRRVFSNWIGRVYGQS